MGKEGRAPIWTGHRRVAAAISVSLVVVLVGAGIAFANSVSASKVAVNAASLHWANAASGSAALTRAALAQALTFAQLHSRGEASADDLQFALDHVAGSLAELVELEAGSGHSSSQGFLAVFVSSAEATREALGASDLIAARTAIEALDGHFTDLIESLRLEQDDIQEAIALNTEMGQRVNGLILFAMTLVLPAAAVTLYWWIARRQIVQQKENSRLELEAERKVSRAKDQFIAGLSHELRTPLTSIYGFAEILADSTDGGADTQSRELAGIIANEAAELSRMVDDLIVASRLDSTGVEMEVLPTRIASVVESAIAPFERAGLEVKRQLNGTVAQVDAARLRHILVNLISNAARHGGGRIGIEVTAEGDAVDIEVWDDGPGVPEERVPHLFAPYANSGSSPLVAGSVGLGLAVASRLADRMNGQIKYQRFAGKSYFVLSVPGFDPTARTETPVMAGPSS